MGSHLSHPTISFSERSAGQDQRVDNLFKDYIIIARKQ